MGTSKKLKEAQQRLKKAQAAGAKFEAKHKSLKLTSKEETEQQRLTHAELSASIDVTEAKERPKKISK